MSLSAFLTLLGGWRAAVFAAVAVLLGGSAAGLAISRETLKVDLAAANQRLTALQAAQTETLATLAKTRDEQKRADTALAEETETASALAASTALQHSEITHAARTTPPAAADPLIATAVDGLYEDSRAHR